MGETSDKIKLPLGQIAVARMPASELHDVQADRAASRKLAQGQMRGKRFGEILVAHGRLDPAVLEDALPRHPKIGCRLSELLVAEGHISESDVIRALSEQTGIPYVSERRVATMDVPEEAVALLPAEKAKRLHVLPVALRGRELVCAVPEPRDLAFLDELKFLAGVPAITGVFATADAIRLGQRRFYDGEEDDEGGWEQLTARDGKARSAFAPETPWPALGVPVNPRRGIIPTSAAPPMLFPVAGVRAAAPPVVQPAGVVHGESILPELIDANAEIVEPELIDASAEIFEPDLIDASAEIFEAELIDASAEILEAELIEAGAELVEAELLEDEMPPAVRRLRTQMLALLLEQRSGVGQLPSLVRRLALRLGAPTAEVERAAAAAEALVLLSPAGTCRLPAADAIEAALGESGAACSDLFAALGGGAAEAAACPAAAAFVTAAAWVDAAANDEPPARILRALQEDPRLPAAALGALGDELLPTLPKRVDAIS